MKKKFNLKKLLVTFLLLCLVVVIFYSIVGIFVSGVVVKNQKDDQKVMDKIQSNDKSCNTIERNSFKYVTFTCSKDDQVIIYDNNAKKIASRERNEFRLDEIEKMIAESFPQFQGLPIRITYGNDSVVYMIEKKGDFLLIDFDTLDVVFHSEG